MSAILYVEGSLDAISGAAGWGATLDLDGAAVSHGAFLLNDFGTATTIMELSAVSAAAHHFERIGLLTNLTDRLTIAMRSTAALAILRWVYPEAPFHGIAQVWAPKALKPGTQNAQCLYDLHELTERLVLDVALRHVEPSPHTEAAFNLARAEMQRARNADRSPRR